MSSCFSLLHEYSQKCQVLLQLSDSPLFDLDYAVFRPPICFDIKAEISGSEPFGIVLGSSLAENDEVVEVLKVVRGSRFEGILEPGDNIRIVNEMHIKVRMFIMQKKKDLQIITCRRSDRYIFASRFRSITTISRVYQKLTVCCKRLSDLCRWKF